ncbi:MAG: redoxin domain-containing protein, partial [Anaerolineae bacterium]
LVATVNSQAITRDMVAAELKISRLNVLEPLPALAGADLARAQQEAVNQLVTRRLILQAAAGQNFRLEEAAVRERARLLFGSRGEQALDDALQQAGASRADLLWWVSEIATVEAFTVQVIMAGVPPPERQQAYNAWLNRRQAEADISIFLDGAAPAFAPLAGQTAPDFTLPAVGGERVSLADYRGQVVLVNFWATWCPSCIAEMPDYEAVYRQYTASGAPFVVLAVNLQESRQQAEQFSAGLGLTFPVLLDQTGDVTIGQYRLAGMPGSVIVDRNGVIAYRHTGPMSGDLLKQKLAELGLAAPRP